VIAMLVESNAGGWVPFLLDAEQRTIRTPQPLDMAVESA
jgi:hypothetical protein